MENLNKGCCSKCAGDPSLRSTTCWDKWQDCECHQEKPICPYYNGECNVRDCKYNHPDRPQEKPKECCPKCICINSHGSGSAFQHCEKGYCECHQPPATGEEWKEKAWQSFMEDFTYDCDGSGCTHSSIPHEGKNGKDNWELQDKIKKALLRVIASHQLKYAKRVEEMIAKTISQLCDCEVSNEEMNRCKNCKDKHASLKDWRVDFDNTWTAINGTKMSEDIKSFITTLLNQQKEELLGEIGDWVNNNNNYISSSGPWVEKKGLLEFIKSKK